MPGCPASFISTRQESDRGMSGSYPTCACAGTVQDGAIALTTSHDSSMPGMTSPTSVTSWSWTTRTTATSAVRHIVMPSGERSYAWPTTSPDTVEEHQSPTHTTVTVRTSNSLLTSSRTDAAEYWINRTQGT